MSTITCAISKLPILPGEEIVCLPLHFSRSTSMSGNTGVIETKGMRVYSHDVFSPMGLIIKGIAGEKTAFSIIEKDGNTECLELFFNREIEEILSVLTQEISIENPESRKSSYLKNGIAVFIKRSIFDYIVNLDMKDDWDGNIFDELGKRYDEGQEDIKAWNKIESSIELSERMFHPENPFGSFDSVSEKLFRSIESYLLRYIYQSGLLKNSIRQNYVETYTFLARLNTHMGYAFLPTLKGNEQDAIHEEIAKVSLRILKGKEEALKEEAEEWE